VTQHDTQSVTNLLQAGFLPVLHGDCVLDSSKGCAILSGDTIIEVMGHKWDNFLHKAKHWLHIYICSMKKVINTCLKMVGYTCTIF